MNLWYDTLFVPVKDLICVNVVHIVCHFLVFHVSIERPISCELPAGSYSRASGEAWRCFPDPEADKPRLDLACMSIYVCVGVCVCTCVCLRGVTAVFISTSGPLCFPVHQAPAVVEASQPLSPMTLL